jgi:soluble lytic murein transglycosylase
LLFTLGDTLQAVETAYDLTTDARTRHLALDIVDDVIRRVRAHELSDDALLEFCSVLIKKNRLADADRLMAELLERSLGEDEARRTLLLADLYYRERRYSKSFQLVRNKFSDPSLERSAALTRARIYRKIGQAESSADAYTAFSQAYPYDAKAAEALLVAADLYLRVGNRKQSLGTLDRIIETYPSNHYAKVATMKLAAYYMDRKHYSRGVAILENSLERSGRRDEELLYYLAESYGRMGKAEKRQKVLDEIYEVNSISFYLRSEVPRGYAHPLLDSNGRIVLDGDGGLLEFLQQVFRQRGDAYNNIRGVLPELSERAADLDANAVYLERGRQFLLMGFRDWAEDELGVLESRRRLPARVSFELGVLYDDFAMHWKSVRAFQRVYYSLSRTIRTTLDEEFKLLMYPVPYPAQVFENCSRYGMAPHLVYAMIRSESLFDLNAVSRAGAMGLMQLMPATGEQAASELGFPDGPNERLFMPEINIAFGIWYASHLLGRCGSDPLMMAAAYNAGFGNARRWFRGSETTIAKVDGIDYRETKGYVKKIVKSSHVYHTYYFGADASIGTGGGR